LKKVILIQTPEKFAEVIPIFCRESLKYGIFDKIYIASDYKYIPLIDSRCVLIPLQRDFQYSSNILAALEYVSEDIMLICCEDHIMVGEQNVNDFEYTYKYMAEHPNVGSLWLSYHKKITYEDIGDDLIAKVSNKYIRQMSLQPQWIRKEYLMNVLTPSADAWSTEVLGSKKAFSIPYEKYCVKKQVYYMKNFYKKGKFIRQDFVDYAIENNIKLDGDRQVFVCVKKGHSFLYGLMTVNAYKKALKRGNLLDAVTKNPTRKGAQ